MEYPEVHHLFAPRHTHLEDIPMLIFDINNAINDLPRSNAKRLHRARSIASVLIKGDIPVCPMQNPLTGISHHRIRLVCAESPEERVELFIKDTDQYLVGFRAGTITGGVETWGNLFVFNDLYDEVPSFLNPVKMGIYSAHSDIGGLVEMFRTFAGFERRVRIVTNRQGVRIVQNIDERTKHDMYIAATGFILIFCEGLRFKSVSSEAVRCLKNNAYLTKLSDKLDDLIHSWGTFSSYALERRKTKRGYKLSEDLPDDEQYKEQKLRKLSHLIGSKGELKLCSFDKDLIISPEKIKQLESVPAATHFSDPMFRRQRGNEVQGARGRARGGARGRARGRGRGRGGRGLRRGAP